MKMTVPVRYRIAALLLLGTAVNYLDRVNISVAAPSMMAHTGMQKDQFGLVFSSFLLGYALMQIPAGISCDRGSPKKIRQPSGSSSICAKRHRATS